MKTFKNVALANLLGLCALPMTASALNFDLYDGELNVRLDTALSYGFAVRLQEQDARLIGRANQTASGEPGLAFSTNGDDGNILYDKGDPIASAFKATSELTAYWGSFGVFARGSVIYDTILNSEDYFDAEDYAGPPGRTQGPATLAQKRDDVQSQVGFDADLLDAYLFGDFDVFGKFVSFRLGKQVLNWGESTFVLNGLNSIVALDASQIRVPGFDIAEVFRPQSMISGSIELTTNTSLEGFYQFDWEPTIIDPSGTYLGTNDFAGIGGTSAQLGFGRAPENAAPLTPCSDGSQCVPFGAGIPRQADRPASDDDQFGGALRVYVPALNDMDLAFYAANYHSHLPLFSGVSRASANDPTTDAAYFVTYPEDIKLYGLSFSSGIDFLPFLGNLAVQGEYSYKQDQPLQLDDVELLLAGLGFPSQIAPIRGSALGNQELVGFRRFNVGQWDLSLSKILGPAPVSWIGYDQALLLLEVAGMHVNNFPGIDELRFEGPGTYLPGDALTAFALGVPQQTVGYPTASSWGYQVAGRLTYNNVFNKFVVEPTFRFQHDVNGISPTPLTNFVEGRHQVTLGLNARYLAAWEFGLGYTNFSGAGLQNLIGDRDFAQVNLKYSF